MTVTAPWTTSSMPRGRDFFLDPYPWYGLMREGAPLWQDPDTGAWIAFRHADVLRILKDQRSFSSALPPMPGQALFTTSMNNTDPPRHDELRALVQKQFSPRRIGAMAPRVEQITDQLVQGLLNAGSGSEFVGAFSGALPAIVVAELLGIPPQDRTRFRGWADDVVLVSEPDQADVAFAAMAALAGYFSDLVDTKRQHPGEDLMTVLVQAHDGGRLSREELLDFGILMLTGGHETTTSLINNTIRTLDEHPQARERVVADPALVPALLEEVLRFRAPVQMLERVTVGDVTMSGRQLPPGAVVLYCMGSANRDPAVFSDPDRFDLDRGSTEHLAFGYGLHACLGNALARLEARIAITVLLRRLPALRVDATPAPQPIRTAQLHGLKQMHLSW